MRNLLNFLNFYSRNKNRYLTTYNDSEKKQKSVFFGVNSIIYSVLFCGSALLGLFLLTNLSENIVFLVLLLLLGIAIALAAIPFFVNALIDMIYQFKINKRIIRWFALAAFLLSIAGLITVAILFVF